MKKLVVMGLTVLPALFATAAMGAETINAAGATFPDPIYQKWFGEYKMAHPDVQINYQALGSGGGIRQLTEGTVDFGASDMPMTDEQMKAHEGRSRCISRPSWERWFSPTTFPGVTGGSEAHSGSDRGHLSWATSRSGTIRRSKSANPGEPAGQGHRGGSPFRWQRHFVRLYRLSFEGQPGLEEQSGRERLRELAARPRRQGQRRRGQGW